jgi:hypothetical protein
LALRASNFLCGLLYIYGIQIHHLNPNFIAHVAIFVHLCEAFLGIEPHFALFLFLFRLKPQPSVEHESVVGEAGFQLKQKSVEKYIKYKFPTSHPCWKDLWFYIGNHKPLLAERTGGVPDRKMSPDLLRGTINLIGGELDVDERRLRTIGTSQSLHHCSVGYHPCHTDDLATKTSPYKRNQEHKQE